MDELQSYDGENSNSYYDSQEETEEEPFEAEDGNEQANDNFEEGVLVEKEAQIRKSQIPKVVNDQDGVKTQTVEDVSGQTRNIRVIEGETLKAL
jgi:hypothetical protein